MYASFESFADDVSQSIESAYEAGQKTLEISMPNSGTIDLIDFHLKDGSSGSSYVITRIPLALPKYLRKPAGTDQPVPRDSEEQDSSTPGKQKSPEDEEENEQNQSQSTDNRLPVKVYKEFVMSGGRQLIVEKGDITLSITDAIVNAANGELQHGGGIAKSIRISGGSDIVKESREYIKKHGNIPVGKVGVTGGGNLPAKRVIHAVGPRWTAKDIFHGKSAIELHNCIYNSLVLADTENLQSVTLPSISSGIFGGNIDACSRIIILAIVQYFDDNSSSGLKSIHLISWDDERKRSFARMCYQLPVEHQIKPK